MYTVDSLLQIAAGAETGLGSFNESENALICALWMEKNGIEQLPAVGPFGGSPFRAGQRVTIKKGTFIQTTHPKGNRHAGRDYTVTLQRVSQGYVHKIDNPSVYQPQVIWVGAGGYYF